MGSGSDFVVRIEEFIIGSSSTTSSFSFLELRMKTPVCFKNHSFFQPSCKRRPQTSLRQTFLGQTGSLLTAIRLKYQVA